MLHKLPLFRLDSLLGLRDIFALGGLAGIGFTVSLLIGELAFSGPGDMVEYARLGVILGSFVAALLSVFLLFWRSRAHRTDKLSPDKVRMP